MPTTPIPVIPFLGSYTQPLAHCNLRQVKRLLLGLNLSQFAEPDGSLDLLYETIVEDLIPEASQRVARYCRTNFDYTKEIWFYDGTGSPEIVLPRRNILFVNAVFLRFLPSQIWYRFVTPRRVDGEEFAAIGGVEPPPPAPESQPPSAEGPDYLQSVQTQVYTGIEDADLFIDSRRRLIVIPARVLYASVGSPSWKYDFFSGTMNVEVHFNYGFAPTAYTDGQPLVFDPITGDVQMTSPEIALKTGGFCGDAPIDWSSGMPKALTQATARLVYADILRRLWRGVSGGLSSMSVDGASESYGSKPFGGDPDDIEAAAFKVLNTFGISIV